MATIISDLFTEAGDTALDAHTPDIGTGWTLQAASTLQVEGGAGVCETIHTSVRHASEDTDVGADIMDITADVRCDSTNTDRIIGVVGRIPSGERGNSNGYWAYRIPSASGTTYHLDKVIAGSPTDLGTYVDTGNAFTTQTIKLEIRTAAKKVYVDGVERISSDDDNLTGNNFTGIVMRHVNPRMDNFLVEDVSSAATTTKLTWVSP